MDAHHIREIIQEELRRRGSNPFRATRETGLPENALRYLLEGREPKAGRLAEICQALGLEFYIGPPRGESESPPSSPPPALIPDPKPPAAAPKGVRALEAAGAVGQRFTDEALREEIHTLLDTTIAMREEMARREAATETALKELTSQLSRTAPKKLEDDSALAEPDSGKVLEFPEPDPDAEICGLPYRVNIGGAAGPGAFVDDENVIKLIGFRRDWLRKHGINPDKCSLIDVRGDSMEPELRDKAIILIDHQRTRRLAGRIFAVRSDDGLQIKRLEHDNHDWLLVSDNDKEYKPVPWPREAGVIGQVMWTGRTL